METKREWTTIKEYEEILFDFYNGIARITINRERYRNAFTPTTTTEMSDALYICRERPDINVVVLTGAGDTAFCAGGDMHVKGHGGYIGKDGVARLNVLDVQKQIRSIPKPVIAAVNGFAIGGGHVLHVVCDLTIASENAIFGQTGPRVGSFDAGFGSSYLARIVGQKKAREIWFLCRKYNAQEALDMGLVNKVVPLDKLEDEYVGWAEEMMLLSPLALRMIKAGLTAELDGQAGIQELAGDATMLYRALGSITFAVDSRDCLVIHTPHFTHKQFVTNDVVELVDERTFRWTGRYDHVINSGGVKIFPARVEQKIAGLLTRRFFIAAAPDEKWGQCVALAIEGDPLSPADEAALLARIREAVDRYEMPRRVVYLPAFAETSSGKVIRRLP